MFTKEQLGWKEISVLMLIAYIFSFAIRLIWVWQFKDNSSFMWNEQLMINTNDGYFFASAVEYLLNGIHGENPRVHIAISSYPGLVYATYLLTKFTPMSLETSILYMPAIISSLVAIPLILTGKLLKLPWVGFFSALIGSIAWSYYNRTMIGYYDSDMFAVLMQFTILYLFLFTIYHKEDKNVLWLTFFILVYPFFYPQGLSLIYVMFALWVVYQLIFQRKEQNSYLFIIVVSISLWTVPIWIKFILIIAIFTVLEQIKEKIDNKKFFYLALLSLMIFFIFGNVFGLIFEKVNTYLSRGNEIGGLHFYQVIQTVREAESIPWETVANRIIGGYPSLVASVAGYILLAFRHKQFLIALPLIGVGIFAHWAGLRFTVYAVPVAAFSVTYLFYVISDKWVAQRKFQWLLMALLTATIIFPNIKHIIGYRVPTVLNNAEVQDLTKLNEIATSKDYTLAWWDYGYPIWFYSGTSTLIDGAKHHRDNFIISTIMQTGSPQLAANLSRLAVEIYVDSNYSVVADTIFKNGKKDQVDPNLLLSQLQDEAFRLPAKSRDIYLYLPYRMLGIFPVVMVFGNLDLNTGKELRQSIFYPIALASSNNGVLAFTNGIVFDTKKGKVRVGSVEKDVKSLIITQNMEDGNIALQKQPYRMNGEIVVVFMKSYNKFVVMDTKTFQSMYVQMFILGRYDKNLFELVVASPYSRIYKIKR